MVHLKLRLGRFSMSFEANTVHSVFEHAFVEKKQTSESDLVDQLHLV